MTASFSVVVPTFRRPGGLRGTLERLMVLDYPPDLQEVIVVDDGSGDETPVVAHDFAGGAVSVRFAQQPNSGVAAARNRGGRLARGEIVVFLDDDILVEPSFLRLHDATHRRFPRALVNGEWVFPPALVEELRRTPFGRFRLRLENEFRRLPSSEALEDDCFECPVLSGGYLSIARDLFWELGGFDQEFPAAGAEDQELSYRALAAGCLLIRNRAIRLMHDDSHLSLEGFCRREERRAATVVVLARRYPASPAAVQYGRSNGPIATSDGPVLVVKKLVKSIGSREPVLRAVRLFVRGLERAGASDAMLARSYSSLAGLHIFRGFRHALENYGPASRSMSRSNTG